MNQEFIRRNANGSVTLCGRGDGKCCPTMQIIDENRVKITDDYGNSIIVTKEEAALMSGGMTMLDESTAKPKQLLFD
jgi:hypothetical protein